MRGVVDGVKAEMHMYDHPFLEAQPDAGGKIQFECHGYFVADRVDHQPGKPVFNLAVGLQDSWGK